MTAIVAVELRPFNEIHLIADTRVTSGKYIYPNGLQKIIPVITKDKRHVGAIGFSGYIAPLKRVVHHLIVKKQITSYRGAFVIESVVENLRGFIQEGFSSIKDESIRKQAFVMMFTAVDTARKSVIKDVNGKIIENPSLPPIYLSKTYLFKPNKKLQIEVTVSEQEVTIIGEGEKVVHDLSPKLSNTVSFGHPYDGTPHFRSWLMGNLASEKFQNEKLTSVGGPYWIWEILDPNRESRQYWKWEYGTPEGSNIEVEQSDHNFVIKHKYNALNPFTKKRNKKTEKKIIYHILNWPDGSLAGAIA